MDISSVNSDLIRGNVTTIILGSLWSQDRYGYDILKEIETRSEGQYKLKQPTLYNQLKRLEKQGLISSYDGDPDDTGGGRRRYYALTAEGRNFLVRERTEYEYSRTILDKLVSDRTFDFEADTAPFNTDELRPYIKKDGEKSRVVYKEKEVEKVVYVEKKVFFDADGNEVDEETARASAAAARASLSEEELAELDARKEREIEEIEARHREEIERIQTENRLRYEKLGYEMTDALSESEADRAEAVARIEAERQEAVRRLENMLDNANLAVADKIAEIEERHRLEIEKLSAERNAELLRAEEALKEEAEQLAEQKRAEIEKLSAEREEELKRLADEKQAEIDEIRRSRETELEEIEARHREEIEKLSAEREEELKRLADEKQAEIDEIRRSREAELEEIEARHREEIERINSESAALSAEIENRRAAFEAEREEELRRLEAEREETEKKFAEERQKFEEEKREEDEKREEYARMDAARREELEKIEQERIEAEKRFEEEREKFREEIRAEEERRAAEERAELERKAEEERVAREREEALMSQATMSLSDIFRELDARSEYTEKSNNSEKLVVEDAEWVVPSSDAASVAKADEPVEIEPVPEPVAVAVGAYDEEESAEKAEEPVETDEDDLPFFEDEINEDDADSTSEANDEDDKSSFDDAHSEKLREIAAELAYVRKKIDALDAEAVAAPYAADLLRRAESDSEKASENKSERVERNESSYYTADTVTERRAPETTLRDLFKRLDERAAEIDSKKPQEEEVEEPVYEAEAEPSPMLERGEFAMSAVRNSRTEPFAYERGDVNYKEFFATVAAESAPEPETEKAPVEKTASHAEADLKTRLYAEGFKLRPYDRGSTAEYYTFNFIRSNRLLRDCWLIVLAVFLVEAAAMWASTATMISYVYYLPIIAGGTVLMLIPSFVYLANPSKRRRADFNVKLSFINRFMIMIELAVILVLVAFFGVGVSVRDTQLILMTMVLPIILLTNLPLSSIIYYLLYRTRKYHTA